MPYRGHNTSSRSSHQNEQYMPPSAASGILQAAQALGSIGAPTGNLRTATSGHSGAATDKLYSNMSSSNTTGSSAPNPALSTAIPSSTLSNTQQFETPRRSQSYGRQSDELHLSSSNAASAQRGQPSPRDYSVGAPPRISLDQATPESAHNQQVGALPGALQSGGISRPGPLTSNTTPTIPTLPQTMSQDSYATPSRSANLGLTHNYSRSSPSATYDGQNYAAFSPAPGNETSGYASPTTQKYTPQGQPRNISNTPLGLADIRPRADSGLSDSLPGANPYSYDGANAIPTNSNYLAPWAIYAFDWCKWPAQNHDAGKVAVGSYLEDGHNFVRVP